MNQLRPPARPLCALVVDDDLDTVESTSALLTCHGFRILTATNGPEALQTAEEYPPDVVLLDLSMPIMDGFEVLDRLREGCAGLAKRPLFVAVTGRGGAEDRQRTSDAGFDLHLLKPVDPAELVGVMNRLARAIADPDGVSCGDSW